MNTTGLALNVWNNSYTATPDWRMAIYLDKRTGTDTSEYISIERPTPDQIDRYLEISQDSDWWVYDLDPKFDYILFGRGDG